MGSHIFRSAMQPATNYADATFDPPMEGGWPPEKMLFCESCDQCWPASQMAVQCYYDGMRLWCAEGHGCKDPARIEAYQERTRARRSIAQIMRHARAKEEAANVSD